MTVVTCRSHAQIICLENIKQTQQHLAALVYHTVLYSLYCLQLRVTSTSHPNFAVGTPTSIFSKLPGVIRSANCLAHLHTVITCSLSAVSAPVAGCRYNTPSGVPECSVDERDRLCRSLEAMESDSDFEYGDQVIAARTACGST